MIKAIIVEDEQPAIDILTGMLVKNHPEIQILFVCKTILDAVEKINLHHPDLIFLDINLDRKKGGFEVLQFTNSVNYKVIFTTSTIAHAIKAVKFSALDFLLKPFEEEELKGALNKYTHIQNIGSRENIKTLLYNENQTYPWMEKVGIPGVNGIVFIPVSDIIFCQSKNTSTEFNLTNQRKDTVTKTLKSVQELMSDHYFYRVHDSFLINLYHIKKYVKGGEGGIVELIEGHQIDVARRRKDDFLKTLANLKMIFGR